MTLATLSLFPALAVTSLALVAYLFLLDSLLEVSSLQRTHAGHASVTRGTALQSLLARSAVTSARAVGMSASKLSSTTTVVGMSTNVWAPLVQSGGTHSHAGGLEYW